MKQVQDELECLVNKIKKVLCFDNMTFYYSTPYEFISHISEKKNVEDRYPFFFVSSLGVTYNDDICSVDNIVIATLSKPEWKSKDRDLKTFKPILIPVYDEFKTRLFNNRNLTLHTEGDVTFHYFYGETGIQGYEGLIFPNFIDAIQLRGFKFRITDNKTCNK